MTEWEQYSLYDGTPPHQEPGTSSDAALSVLSDTHRLQGQVFRAIQTAGDRGRTDDELEQLLGLRHQTVSARRRELVLLDLIEDSGDRRRTSSGRGAIVWKAKI
ncbi:MAG: helix-turn-helix transcriptional regulator [Mycobacterium sp.]|nr:helix-turn-helix transcriptional regulator [Mycobacterium sp.]